MVAGERSPIIRALATLPHATGAEVRVHLSRRWIEWDALNRAKKLLQVYSAQTSQKSDAPSVLIYANLRRRTFALVAHTAVLDAIGENTFRQLATLLEEDFHSTQPELAIAVCVRALGAALAAHFPVANPHAID